MAGMKAFTAEDLERLASALVGAGADEIMPRFGKLAAHEARRKTSAFDIVTDADEAAERAIASALHARFPGSLVIGEEAADRDPKLLDRLQAAELCFVVDPLDGRRTNWFRCAAHGYLLAAAGRCHVLFYNRLMPWDHAAGWLLHREAGGYSAHFDGTPYRPAHTSDGVLCAPDRACWEAVRTALFDRTFDAPS